MSSKDGFLGRYFIQLFQFHRHIVEMIVPPQPCAVSDGYTVPIFPRIFHNDHIYDMIDACFNHFRFADRDSHISSKCLTVFLLANLYFQWPACVHYLVVDTLVIRDHFAADGCIAQDDVLLDLSRGTTSKAFIGVVDICQVIEVDCLSLYDATRLNDRLACFKFLFVCLVLCPCYFALSVHCYNWKRRHVPWIIWDDKISPYALKINCVRNEDTQMDFCYGYIM